MWAFAFYSSALRLRPRLSVPRPQFSPDSVIFSVLCYISLYQIVFWIMSFLLCLRWLETLVVSGSATAGRHPLSSLISL
jgi:hypothetical protein